MLVTRCSTAVNSDEMTDQDRLHIVMTLNIAVTYQKPRQIRSVVAIL